MEGLSATYQTNNPPCGACKNCSERWTCLTLSNANTLSGSVFFNALNELVVQSAVERTLEGVGLRVQNIKTTTDAIRNASDEINTKCMKKSKKVVLHKDRPR